MIDAEKTTKPHPSPPLSAWASFQFWGWMGAGRARWSLAGAKASRMALSFLLLTLRPMAAPTSALTLAIAWSVAVSAIVAAVSMQTRNLSPSEIHPHLFFLGAIAIALAWLARVALTKSCGALLRCERTIETLKAAEASLSQIARAKLEAAAMGGATLPPKRSKAGPPRL